MTFRALEVTASSIPEWIRKAATIVNRLQGLVQGISTSVTEAHDAQALATGWGNYSDSGTAQVIPANADTLLSNNRANVIETQKPSDIATFYDGAAIRGGDGDGLSVLLEFTFTPNDDTATMLQCWVDIGGSFAPLFPQAFPVTSGAGEAFRVLHIFTAYVGATWAANGARAYVRADGPGVVSARRYLIHRLHRGR